MATQAKTGLRRHPQGIGASVRFSSLLERLRRWYGTAHEPEKQIPGALMPLFTLLTRGGESLKPEPVGDENQSFPSTDADRHVHRIRWIVRDPKKLERPALINEC